MNTRAGRGWASGEVRLGSGGGPTVRQQFVELLDRVRSDS
jgi:hypothetical protein